MNAIKQYMNQKYFWIELGFILFLSFGVTLISDLEYSAYVKHDISKFSEDFGYRLITESLEVLLYSLFYWIFIRRCVFKRNIVAVILCCIGFVIIDRVFDKYVTNWMLMHADIVSAEFRKRAFDDMHRSGIFFSFNYLLISSIFPLTGLAFLVRSLNQDSDMKVLKEQQLVSELNYLKAQLHPHFFFNTINNIYALAMKQSAETAPMVARLGEMMRYILYEADKKTVLLSREIAFLSNYIEAERIRHQDQISIEFDVQGIKPDFRIEPLLLLPFIENAFKHGLEEETKSGFVHIVICQTDDELTLEVSNSKPVLLKEKAAAGIGVTNVCKRLAILYPEKHQLDVTEETDRYEVSLLIANA